VEIFGAAIFSGSELDVQNRPIVPEFVDTGGMSGPNKYSHERRAYNSSLNVSLASLLKGINSAIAGFWILPQG